MDERLEYVRCLLCGGDDIEVFSESDETEKKIVRCRRDRLIYLNPRPDAKSLSTFFEWEFIANREREWYEFYKSLRRAVLRREARLIKQLKPKGGNLLDVACGMGTFLENFLSPPEWRLFGIDESRLAIDAAKALDKANLFVGALRDTCYPDSFFDVVSLLDALYYFHDPLSDLLEVRRILKPNGLLALEIPGLYYTLIRKWGPIALALDGKWWSLTPLDHHLYYFSAPAIKQLLDKAGFRVVRVVPEQASLGQHRLGTLANHLQFTAARLLFAATGGKLSIAARDLYLSIKDPQWTQERAGDIALRPRERSVSGTAAKTAGVS
jgi:SAM-dependent methyltransferase